jgi:hypothetical protein
MTTIEDEVAPTRDLPAALAAVPILVEIHEKALAVDEARENLASLISEVSNKVVEAVDDGEPYRDIARAAGRSVGWVQVTMSRIGVEGPRVRRRPSRLRTPEKREPVQCPDCGELFLRLPPHQRGGKCRPKK